MLNIEVISPGAWTNELLLQGPCGARGYPIPDGAASPVVGRPTQLIYISDIYLLDDQHRNTNMNDKDHLVGQLTTLHLALQPWHVVCTTLTSLTLHQLDPTISENELEEKSLVTVEGDQRGLAL